MEALAKFAGWLILLTITTLLFGWMATVIWSWYIVPTLGLAPLKYKTALGFSYLLDIQFVGTALAMTVKDYHEIGSIGRLLLTLFAYGIILAVAGFFFLVLP